MIKNIEKYMVLSILTTSGINTHRFAHFQVLFVYLEAKKNLEFDCQDEVFRNRMKSSESYKESTSEFDKNAICRPLNKCYLIESYEKNLQNKEIDGNIADELQMF